MEYTGRRNRRGRPRSRTSHQQVHYVQRPPPCSAYNGFCSFFVLVSLITIIYLMLDYHCKICSKKCDVLNITKSINDIAVNISRLKESYTDLEKSIIKFSGEIPKIEGQIEILEALANTMERGDHVWNPKKHLSLPNVDVFLKEPIIKFAENPYSTVKKNVTEKVVQFIAPIIKSKHWLTIYYTLIQQFTREHSRRHCRVNHRSLSPSQRPITEYHTLMSRFVDSTSQSRTALTLLSRSD